MQQRSTGRGGEGGRAPLRARQALCTLLLPIRPTVNIAICLHVCSMFPSRTRLQGWLFLVLVEPGGDVPEDIVSESLSHFCRPPLPCEIGFDYCPSRSHFLATHRGEIKATHPRLPETKQPFVHRPGATEFSPNHLKNLTRRSSLPVFLEQVFLRYNILAASSRHPVSDI